MPYLLDDDRHGFRVDAWAAWALLLFSPRSPVRSMYTSVRNWNPSCVYRVAGYKKHPIFNVPFLHRPGPTVNVPVTVLLSVNYLCVSDHNQRSSSISSCRTSSAIKTMVIVSSLSESLYPPRLLKPFCFRCNGNVINTRPSQLWPR